MSGIPDFKNLVFKDTSFANLMNKRIYNVLLIATKYDAFMLEDDGRVDEQIFNEYTSLSLRYPPRFTQVTTEEEALAELKDRNCGGDGDQDPLPQYTDRGPHPILQGGIQADCQ